MLTEDIRKVIRKIERLQKKGLHKSAAAIGSELRLMANGNEETVKAWVKEYAEETMVVTPKAIRRYK